MTEASRAESRPDDLRIELGEAHERLFLATTDLQRASARAVVRRLQAEAAALGVELPSEEDPSRERLERGGVLNRRPARPAAPVTPAPDDARGWQLVGRFPAADLLGWRP